MTETENKSYRRMLIEIIVKSFTENYLLFDATDSLTQNLQERLYSNLKFETNVFDVETENGQTFGKISFEDENGVIKIINFTITGNSVAV